VARTTVLDAPIGRVALRLIRLFGKDVTYVEVGESVYNKATGKNERPTTDHPTRGVFQDVQKSLVDGTTIRATDETLLIPARDLEIEPDTSGRVIDSGKNLQVLRTKAIRSGEQTAVWLLVVRR
jgi:hypothetical protein